MTRDSCVDTLMGSRTEADLRCGFVGLEVFGVSMGLLSVEAAIDEKDL